jgi:glycosyltransferase involved in cell wall biosynthesis
LSTQPRVAFDLTPVISGRTGIARYAAQLMAALRGCPVTLQPFAVGRSSSPVPPGTRHVRLPARVLTAWWRAVPSPAIERLAGPADLVHATGLFLPVTRLPLVVTVHDLGALRYPALHPARQLSQQRALLGALGRASAILAVSVAAADELAGFGIDRQRVVVAPLGLTPLTAPDGGSDVELPARNFLLTVGETAARKGYDVLLQALTRLKPGLELVMVGPPGADEQRLRRWAAELGVAARVHRLGVVSDDTLAALYRQAVALCFPSIAEGFGLPVLEAMAAGTPVLASDLPAVREVAGSAAAYAEGQDAEAWAKAVDALASSPETRLQMADAGRARARRFTWERTAEATLEAYRLALGSALPATS